MGDFKEEAEKYYSNIVIPYGDQVKKAIEAVSKLDIDMIAPSHGIIWRTQIPQIIKQYKKWSNYETEEKALIIYDSMWGSTEKIAYALREGIEESEIPVNIRNLRSSHISDIITDLNSSKYVLIGSPTINNTMLPTLGGFLTYLKGLRPRNRVGFVFGSYGWGGQAVGEIEEILKSLSWSIPIESYKINYVPEQADLKKAKEIGKRLVKINKK
jgi:flavorubredoxin